MVLVGIAYTIVSASSQTINMDPFSSTFRMDFEHLGTQQALVASSLSLMALHAAEDVDCNTQVFFMNRFEDAADLEPRPIIEYANRMPIPVTYNGIGISQPRPMAPTSGTGSLFSAAGTSRETMASLVDKATNGIHQHQYPNDCIGAAYLHPVNNMNRSPKQPRSRITVGDESTRSLKRQKSEVSTNGIDDETVPRFNHHQNLLWIEQFKQILKFKEVFGHCCVPITFTENQVLARWVKRQRYQYKRYQKGKPSIINASRFQMLNSIGFTWNAHSVAWQEKFNELAAFKEARGNCNISSFDRKFVQLSTWAKCQRRQYKLYISGQPSNITIDRIEALKSLGFSWSRGQVPSGVSDENE